MIGEAAIPEFSLFGGPLQKLAARLGWGRRGMGTFGSGLALGLAVWCVLVLLAILRGSGRDLFSLSVVGVHVRLLIALPLLCAGEAFVAPRMAAFVRHVLASGLVPEDEQPALAADIRKVGRLAASPLAEALLLFLALAAPLVGILLALPGVTGEWAAVLGAAGQKLTPVRAWHLFVGLPLFRLLLFRWLWRVGLWWFFLHRLGKRKLRLIPTHSDRAGGLGYLEVVQEHFAPLVAGITAILSAYFVEGLAQGTTSFEALYALVPGALFFAAVLVIGPLFLFTPELWACRTKGTDEYMAMAARYARAFDRKWLRAEPADGASQLGTPDLQSLADLTNSVNVVRGVRLIPCGRRLLLELAACVVVPILPAVLLRFPARDIAVRLFRALTGL